jgi:hypothetical protein
MNKKPQKLLLVTFLLTVFLSSIAYAMLIPSAHAAENTNPQKALDIMNNVIGVDLLKCTATPKDNPSNSYLGIVPQDNVRYTLGSNGSETADIRLSFVNGKLRVIHVLGTADPSCLKKTSSNSLEMAKDFLSTYHSYSENPFYSQLKTMLNDISVGENLTKTSSNIKLEVSNSEYYDSETYSWTYSNNGVEAKSKCVTISYESGFLKYFIDNWDLYQIGSTTVNISEKQAIETGMQFARNFSWKISPDNDTYQVKNYTVANAMVWETVYLSNLYADNPRSEDPLMLYPIRHVWVSLDKFYPGNVYGLNVYIWADTGNVAYIHERVSSSDPPSDSVASNDTFKIEAVNSEAQAAPTDAPWMVFPAFAFMAGPISVFFLFKGRKTSRRRLSKFVGGAFCLLMFLSTFLFVTNSTVEASSPSSRVEIWGAESIGAYNQSLEFSWRKTNEEIYYQDLLGNLISVYSGDNGYDAINSQGDNGHTSFKAAILDDISYNDANYPRVAVVDFDHGNGNAGMSGIPPNEFHYLFEDNNGTSVGQLRWTATTCVDNGVYDMEIYPRVASGKVCFAFINTCNSANYESNFGGYYYSPQGLIPGTDRARGMPFAWSHRSVYPGNYGDFDVSIHLSSDGYNSQTRDKGDFVYLGFDGGSASLNQTIDGSGSLYWQWFRDFFWFVFSSDQSVNDALDDASIEHYESDFGNTDLAKHFNPIWPMYNHDTEQWENQTKNGKLVVYGNGNIHLYQNGGIWNFDEGQGSTAYDSTVHDNDCTISGATWTNGKMNDALDFDGSNDIVYRSYSSSLNGLSAVTLMEWVKLDSVPAAYSVNLGGIPCEYWLEYRDSQYVSLSTYINSQYNGDGFYANLADGKWHLLTMTYDGTSKKGYLDGTLMAESYLPGTLDSTYYQFKIGESFPPSQNYNGCPDGIIDEVRVYSYAFSAEQIADEAIELSYHLNGGNSAYDSSPFSNIGTIYGATSASGVRGSALSFDGDSYVEVADANSLDLTNTLTVAAWVNLQADHNGASPTMLRKQENYLLEVGDAGNNKPAFLLWFNDQTTTRIDGPEVSKNEWHHWVGTYDGNTMKLYIDGSLVANASVSKTMATSAYPLRIGHYDTEWFNGVIDEIRICDRALSGDEIVYYYNTHLPYHWIMTETLDDTYSYSIETPFEIDGQTIGGLYSYYNAVRGEHTVSVDATVYHPYYGWYEFTYFTVDGANPDYNNPMDVTIIKDTTITAHYVWYDYP